MKGFFKKLWDNISAFFRKVWQAVVTFFKNEKDSIVKPTVVLLCICIIIPLALAVTNKVTVKQIAKLEAKNSKTAMEQLVKADTFTEKTADDITYTVAQNDGNDVAFIFKSSAKGYGGKNSVTVMTAIAPDGKVLNLKVLDVANETPGLGQNAAKPEFYSQFKGMSGKIKITDIDTVTSATITSKAVLSCVNDALAKYEKLSALPITLPETENNETEVIADEKQ